MKRLFDLVLASLALLALSPILVALALAVKLTSRGPAIYRGDRIGLHGRPFHLLKFRSMYVDDNRGAAITRAGDPRVTPVGRILRKYKLDELPQLLNVIRGEMSLVGPRPESPRYTALYDAAQQRILDVRPGITSAASVQYRDEESVLTGEEWERTYIERVMPDKLRIDLAYLERRTLLTDLGLILKTIAAIVRRD
jgi:lipopolysaccharide/colanic/teichoic acid biosynthesis glycosyltransferase